MQQSQPEEVPLRIEITISKAFMTLHKLPCIFIKQKFDLIELVGVCERSTTHYIYAGDLLGTIPDFKMDIPIFKSKEQSTCLQRKCICTNCRSYEIVVKNYDFRADGSTVLRFKKEPSCTFCCFSRPSIDIFTEGRQKIGSLQYPSQCISKGVIINDPNGQLLYRVTAECCQWPFTVHCPCDQCEKAVFKIFNAQNSICNQMQKRASGLCTCCCEDQDYFKILFPKDATPEGKALLLAAGLFLDYNYFELDPKERTGK